MILKTSVISTLLLFFASSASASTADLAHKYDEVYKTHKMSDDILVMKKYKQLCSKNEMQSCRILGIISYKKGWKAIGRRLLKRSCIGGVAGACHYLAFLYEKLGYSKSAGIYYRIACDKGHQGACLSSR